MVKITSVEPNSRAHRAGISAGDILLSMNGNEIFDVLDYRFYLAETHLSLSLRSSEREAGYTVEIKKGEYDDIGLSFETPLMDQKRSCHNKCIFCFIDQLPKGLRETLYFKDDDSRLSFLHGNYVTLTNMTEHDVERILKMHLSPINISVHTTDPALRVKMMKNRRAGEVLSYLKRFRDGGITLSLQIVLCKGYNDGNALDRTMRDLSALAPAVSSVSVVPAGLTRFRDGLTDLAPFSKEECREVIKQVNDFGDQCLLRLGSRIFYCADEFYIKAEEPLPPDDYYEDYPQIENGVGMLRDFETTFGFGLKAIQELLPMCRLPRRISLVTGVAAYEQIARMAEALMRTVPGLSISVYPIKNRFFGETITVAGLLTGQDMLEQLQERQKMGENLGEALYIPENTLRDGGDLFLCGMTPEELSEALGLPVIPAPNDGEEWIQILLGL